MSKRRQTNSYPQVIEILQSGKMDAQRMVVELAKRFPSTFLKIADVCPPNNKGTKHNIINYKGVTIDTSEPWHSEVVAYMREGQKIPAIKLFREHTDLGLKESKYYVEGEIRF